MDQPKKETSNKSLLLRYSGMAGQFLGSIGIGVFAGYKIDRWLKFSIPILVWLLPLLIMTGLILRIVKDGNKKDNDDQ